MDDNSDLFSNMGEQPPARPEGGAARGGKAAPKNGSPTGPTTGYDASDIEVLEGLEPVRRRPGMYIGGTDEAAMHHLFAEVIDNSMDEAVAGHATWIEVELDGQGYLSVTDNGRGIPVEPHPKFPDKSTLEVVMTVLHAGGKFDSKAYETSGGLHGVGVSVVNALSIHLEVEVWRNRRHYRQEFRQGIPLGAIEDKGEIHNRRGTKIRFKPDEAIFGAGCAFDPARLFKMARSKAYLFGGVEIRWKCDPALLTGKDAPEATATFHFPGGLKDYLEATIETKHKVTVEPFAGKTEKNGGHGAVEWAVAWFGDDGFVNSYCNTMPTPDGGTHEAGLRVALTRGLKAYGEMVGNKKAQVITTDDVMTSAAAMLSVFIREPEFVGQTKDKLATVEAQRIVENAVRDPFDHWLAASPQQAGKLLEWVIDRAEERLARRKEKEINRKTATRKLRLPGKLADCSANAAGGTELFIVEGDSAGGSAKQARNRETQAVLPLRGKILNVASAGRDKLAAEPADRRPRPGAGLRHAVEIPRRRSALRPHHHHDRCRCRRRPHRLAADHLLLPRDAGTDRQRPSVPRRAAALSPHPGRQDALCARRRPQGRIAGDRVRRQQEGRYRPLQGAGRDDAGPVEGNHHGPEEAHAAAGSRWPKRSKRTPAPRSNG